MTGERRDGGDNEGKKGWRGEERDGEGKKGIAGGRRNGGGKKSEIECKVDQIVRKRRFMSKFKSMVRECNDRRN